MALILPTAQDPISGPNQQCHRMLVSSFHEEVDMAAQPRPAPIPREVPNAQGWGCLGALGWGSGVSLGWQALPCCPAAFPEAPYTHPQGSTSPCCPLVLIPLRSVAAAWLFPTGQDVRRKVKLQRFNAAKHNQSNDHNLGFLPPPQTYRHN